MPGVKTNEVPGTRAVLRHYRMSAYKARQVLDLIRGKDADRAEEILNATPREAARVVGKVLASAVANARNNDQLDPDELFVSACLRRRGHHAQAVAPPGPGPGHQDPQAHLSHHGDREPAARGPAASGAGPARPPRPRGCVPGGWRRRAAVRDAERTSTDGTRHLRPSTDVEELDGDRATSGRDRRRRRRRRRDRRRGRRRRTTTTSKRRGRCWRMPRSTRGRVREPAGRRGREPSAEAEAAAEVERPRPRRRTPPAPKPRRRAAARKKTTKAADDADDGDAGAAGEEEKD